MNGNALTKLRHLSAYLLIAMITPGWATDEAGEVLEVVYTTGFEADEGFDPEFTLVGQGGWQAFGDGGNGLVDNFFDGEGQQAFIGNTPPESEETVEFFSLLTFLNITNFTAEAPIVRFNVTMEIVDSTNGNRDNFRWSTYNVAGDRLFSLDFDNETKVINYALDDDQGLVPTEFTFDHFGIYDLEVDMNFLNNVWCASVNGTVVVNGQPLTTKEAELTLSDIDAVWAIFQPESPGDNYMLFDNYRISRLGLPSTPPRVEARGVLTGGHFVLRVFGEPNTDYRVEVTEDFIHWTPIKSARTSPDDGTFDFIDEDAGNSVQKFYRASTIDRP